MRRRTAAIVATLALTIGSFVLVPVATMNAGGCTSPPWMIPLEGPHLASLSYYLLRFGLVYGFGHVTSWGWGWCAGEA